MKHRKVYCPTCERYVNLQKKSMPHVYHELWVFLIILTAGIGYLFYLLIRRHQKKNTCPHCERTFDLSMPLPEGPRG